MYSLHPSTDTRTPKGAPTCARFHVVHGERILIGPDSTTVIHANENVKNGDFKTGDFKNGDFKTGDSKPEISKTEIEVPVQHRACAVTQSPQESFDAVRHGADDVVHVRTIVDMSELPM